MLHQLEDTVFVVDAPHPHDVELCGKDATFLDEHLGGREGGPWNPLYEKGA